MLRTTRVVSAVLGLLLASAASADPRGDAEALAKAGKFDACGQAYLAIYNADPAAATNDQILFDGSACFQKAGAVGAALQQLELLRRSFPASKLQPSVLQRLGQIYGSLAMWDRAAERYEELAAKYAAEKAASDALSDAAFYRIALGDDAKATANVRLYVKLFGAKNPKGAAEAWWSLVGMSEGKPEQLGYLRDYVKQYGAKGGDDRLVIASSKHAEAAWHGACAVREVDGLCITLARSPVLALGALAKPKQRTRCGPASTAHATVVARDAAKVTEALAAAKAAIAVFERSRSQDFAARHAYARAKMIVADKELEAYLAVGFPANLDFGEKKRAASMKAFSSYVEAKTRAGATAQAQYEAQFAIKDVDQTIFAAARLGQLSAAFSDALMAAEIPKDIRSGAMAADKIDVFCDKMTELSEPLEARALEAYGVCAAKSSELGWVNAGSALCLRELARLRPEKATSSGEVVPEAPRALRTVLERPAGTPTTMTAATCKGLVGSTSKLADDRFASGVAYHTCGNTAAAQRAYEVALQIDPKHAPSMSNLAELAWRAGKAAAAKTGWQTALAVNPRLVAARVNLAAVMTAEKTAKLDEVVLHLQSALAMDPQNVAAYVQLAYAYANANKPRLVKALLAEVEKRAPSDLGLHLARATLSTDLGARLVAARAAVAAEPGAADARMILALALLEVRKYAEAATELGRLPKTYEAHVALGIALRGQRKFADAIAAYEKAVTLDATRPEALYDLAIAQEQAAYVAPDVAATKAALVTAKATYGKALAAATQHPVIAAEAKARGELATKTIAQLDALKP